MARFALSRDVKFFESIARELVDVVVETSVVLYKLIVEDSKIELPDLMKNRELLTEDVLRKQILSVHNIMRDYKNITKTVLVQDRFYSRNV